MRTLVFGAGNLGSVYAHLLYKAGRDVTLLARGNSSILRSNAAKMIEKSWDNYAASPMSTLSGIPRPAWSLRIMSSDRPRLRLRTSETR